MHALDGPGLAPEARIGALAWNGYRHLETFLAVPGTGLMLHTQCSGLKVLVNGIADALRMLTAVVGAAG